MVVTIPVRWSRPQPTHVKGLAMPTKCLDCEAYPTHAGRCAEHHAAYTARVKKHSARRAAIARGHNAAANMRRAVRVAMGAECACCLRHFRPSLLDIDHIRPIALGGEDVDDNVQPLCKGCHRAKTAMDFGKRPF